MQTMLSDHAGMTFTIETSVGQICMLKIIFILMWMKLALEPQWKCK